MPTKISGAAGAADLWGSHWNDTLSCSAAVSNDKRTAVVRLNSNLTDSITVHIGFKGTASIAIVNATVLSATLSAFNTPAAPRKVVPRKLHVDIISNAGGHLSVLLPPHSFATVTTRLDGSSAM